MKYIPEMQTFYERLESTPLSVYAIALWHALMHMNHKQDWSKEFKAASAALCFKTGLEKNMLEQARRELVKKGLLHYEEVEDGQAATYILCPLNNELETNPAKTEEEKKEELRERHQNLRPSFVDTAEAHGRNKNTTVQNSEPKNIADTRNTEINHRKNTEKSITDQHGNDQHIDGECVVKAHLKKLDIHDKMLKHEWQKSVNMALADLDICDETLRTLQKYRPGDPVNIVVQPGQPPQKKVLKEVPKKPDKSKSSPSTKRIEKPRKKQAKRKANSLKSGQIEDLTSMGPFESPPTGKEKVLQTFTF